jgi:hypothetical protein
MPAKTGGSHAIASFVTVLVGAVVSKYVWSIAPPLGEMSLAVVRTVQSVTNATIPVDEQFAGTLVVMVGLSFVWGVFYHFGRHG